MVKVVQILLTNLFSNKTAHLLLAFDTGASGDHTQSDTAATVTSSLPDIAQQVPPAADRPNTLKKHVSVL